MSGPTPPEVPEEFAATYRAAYERAMAAQSDGPRHREPEPDDVAGEGEGAAPVHPLPRRRDRLRVGTHRTPEPPAGPAPAPRPAPVPTEAVTALARSEDDAPTAYERVRDSPWFVPVLLILLALALVLGAYVVGRAFAGQVGTGGKPSSEPSVSTSVVHPMLAA